MRVFTGIVPPENIAKDIVAIQNQFGDNRLEPHLTLTPPATTIVQEEWLRAIEQCCNKIVPFSIGLPKTGQFGNRVLFIDIESEGLQQVQEALAVAVAPYEKDNSEADKNRDYNPHMTLGRKWCGFTKEDFEQMKIITEEYLEKDPILFTVSFIRAYHKPSPGGRYEKLHDFPLKG